jgi:hypothetical protein
MQQKTAFESACGDFEAWRDAATANVFDSDPFFQRLLRRHLGDRYREVEALLRRLADETGADFGQLARIIAIPFTQVGRPVVPVPLPVPVPGGMRLLPVRLIPLKK